MSTQSIYTPESAAQVLGCSVQDVVDHIKNGRLKAAFMTNVANYVITHNDLLAFLKATKDFNTVGKMLSRHVLVVDRDPRVMDIMRMELGRQGCEVKVATTNREISFLADEFGPDVICVHMGATTRAKDSVVESLDHARKRCKSFIILYHGWVASALSPEQVAQIDSIKADRVVTLERTITPLVDAARERLGLKAAGPASYRPPSTGRP